jgi:hypothetical protein
MNPEPYYFSDLPDVFLGSYICISLTGIVIFVPSKYFFAANQKIKILEERFIAMMRFHLKTLKRAQKY